MSWSLLPFQFLLLSFLCMRPCCRPPSVRQLITPTSQAQACRNPLLPDPSNLLQPVTHMYMYTRVHVHAHPPHTHAHQLPLPPSPSPSYPPPSPHESLCIIPVCVRSVSPQTEALRAGTTSTSFCIPGDPTRSDPEWGLLTLPKRMLKWQLPKD